MFLSKSTPRFQAQPAAIDPFQMVALGKGQQGSVTKDGESNSHRRGKCGFGFFSSFSAGAEAVHDTSVDAFQEGPKSALECLNGMPWEARTSEGRWTRNRRASLGFLRSCFCGQFRFHCSQLRFHCGQFCFHILHPYFHVFSRS